jgi:adenylate kinase family enzyme
MSRKTRMSKYTAKTLHSKKYYSSDKIKKLGINKFESIEEVITSVSDDFLV